jgi:endonuclease-8
MPEGPSIVILKEEASAFTGKKILAVAGNTKVDMSGVAGKKVLAFRSWGKQFLIQLDDRTIRIHFMLWGSYSLNEQTRRPNVRKPLTSPI